MKVFYDLHVHSCLSPCGDEDMTPYNLVNMAVLNGMQAIALTDHNSCLNCASAVQAGQEAGLLVIPGMELCTSEEAHVVCLLPDVKSAEAFGEYVRAHIPPVKNRPEIFGEQLIMDSRDCPAGTFDTLLVTASDISVCDVDELVKEYGGICFPAHIDRSSYSVLSTLGDFPEELGFFCAEITAQGDVEALKGKYPILSDMPLLLDSDAHYLENMPQACAWLDLPRLSPRAFIEALGGAGCKWGRE